MRRISPEVVLQRLFVGGLFSPGFHLLAHACFQWGGRLFVYGAVMSFLQIVYASQASESLTEADVLEILRNSQLRNNQLKISGLLLFKERQFLQFIEGPADEVQALYARIAQDPRHHTLRVLSETTGDRLLMPTWAMAYTSPTHESAKGDAFVLDFGQALAICEVLPEHIARFFLEYLKEKDDPA